MRGERFPRWVLFRSLTNKKVYKDTVAGSNRLIKKCPIVPQCKKISCSEK